MGPALSFYDPHFSLDSDDTPSRVPKTKRQTERHILSFVDTFKPRYPNPGS